MPRKSIKNSLMVVLVLARLIPHPWNMTPTIAFTVTASQWYGRSVAIVISLLGLLLSDLALAWLYHYPFLGAWSVFTYSGLFLLCLLAPIFKVHSVAAKFAVVLSAGCAFWLWTNLGAWLFMPLYSKDLSGLWQCYAAALPFLKNQLAGDLLWYAAIVFGGAYVERRLLNIGVVH